MTLRYPVINPAYLTGSLHDWRLDELASLGYEGLEITPACIETSALWQPKAEAVGLAPVCVNSLPELRPYLTGSLSDEVAWRRRATLDKLLRVLDWMVDNGVGFMVVAPSRRAENYQTEAEARVLLIESLKELAGSGRSTILLEAAPFRMFCSAQSISGIVDEVGLPNLGAALDVGHAVLSEQSPLESARTLGSRLRYVQISDQDLQPGVPRLDRHLPLGKGSLNRREVQEAIRGVPWGITVSARHDPVSAARSALEWLREEA